MIVWIVLPHLKTGLFLSQDNYSVLSAEAHLPWPSASPPASPEHKLAIMPCCLALLLSSFLRLPLCPRINRDRGDYLLVSVFYGGGNIINAPFTRCSKQNTAWSLGETVPIAKTLIRHQEEHLLLWGSCSQGKSQKRFLDSGVSQNSSLQPEAVQMTSTAVQALTLASASELTATLMFLNSAALFHYVFKICKKIQPCCFLLQDGLSPTLHRSNPCQNFT